MAFLPLIAGRLQGEFVRFLYFLAHKRAVAFFAAIGQENPSHKELCQQRGAFFYQHRSRVGDLVSRAPKLAHFGWAVPLLHAVTPRFKAPGSMPCRPTLMGDGEEHMIIASL